MKNETTEKSTTHYLVPGPSGPWWQGTGKAEALDAARSLLAQAAPFDLQVTVERSGTGALDPIEARMVLGLRALRGEPRLQAKAQLLDQSYRLWRSGAQGTISCVLDMDWAITPEAYALAERVALAAR
jgi:hypothetical protein